VRGEENKEEFVCMTSAPSTQEMLNREKAVASPLALDFSELE
jgi:hypothetical protein